MHRGALATCILTAALASHAIAGATPPPGTWNPVLHEQTNATKRGSRSILLPHWPGVLLNMPRYFAERRPDGSMRISGKVKSRGRHLAKHGEEIRPGVFRLQAIPPAQKVGDGPPDESIGATSATIRELMSGRDGICLRRKVCPVNTGRTDEVRAHHFTYGQLTLVSTNLLIAATGFHARGYGIGVNGATGTAPNEARRSAPKKGGLVVMLERLGVTVPPGDWVEVALRMERGSDDAVLTVLRPSNKYRAAFSIKHSGNGDNEKIVATPLDNDGSVKVESYFSRPLHKVTNGLLATQP